jgi:predicted nuclease of restriction endonuclease-like (RecB) superfamily
MSQPVTNYISILNTLKAKIQQARYNASIVVNVELLKLYWDIGNTILEQQKLEGWGAKVIDRLAIDLRVEFSDFKGLSVMNLKYMRAFAEAYPEFGIVQTLSAQFEGTDIQTGIIVQASLTQNNFKKNNS